MSQDRIVSDRLEVLSHSPEETQDVGRTLGRDAKPGDVYLLEGGLGAGKTCLTQGILWGLGAEEFARSPTFVLVSQYEGRLTMYHMDLYRLDNAEEVDDLGLDEYLFGDGVSVVEWAEKAPRAFPEESLTVRIDLVDETARRLTLIGYGRRHAGLVAAVRASVSGG